MATKIFCDGCRDEIKVWSRMSPPPRMGDDYSRVLKLSTGNMSQTWDLCDPCQERVALALIELLPSTPRESWFDVLRPKRP